MKTVFHNLQMYIEMIFGPCVPTDDVLVLYFQQMLYHIGYKYGAAVHDIVNVYALPSYYGTFLGNEYRLSKTKQF